MGPADACLRLLAPAGPSLVMAAGLRAAPQLPQPRARAGRQAPLTQQRQAGDARRDPGCRHADRSDVQAPAGLPLRAPLRVRIHWPAVARSAADARGVAACSRLASRCRGTHGGVLLGALPPHRTRLHGPRRRDPRLWAQRLRDAAALLRARLARRALPGLRLAPGEAAGDGRRRPLAAAVGAEDGHVAARAPLLLEARVLAVDSRADRRMRGGDGGGAEAARRGQGGQGPRRAVEKRPPPPSCRPARPPPLSTPFFCL